MCVYVTLCISENGLAVLESELSGESLFRDEKVVLYGFMEVAVAFFIEGMIVFELWILCVRRVKIKTMNYFVEKVYSFFCCY